MILLPHIIVTLLNAYIGVVYAAIPVSMNPYGMQLVSVHDIVIQRDILPPTDSVYRMFTRQAVLGESDTSEKKIQLINTKSEFAVGENVVLTLENPTHAHLTTTIYDAFHKEVTIPMETKSTDDTVTITLFASRSQKPGKYIAIVSDGVRNIEQPFYWSMVAATRDKEVYKKGDKAVITAEVFDEHGGLDCTAQVTMKITKPDKTDDRIGLPASTCANGQEALLPSFMANYTVKQVGQYTIDIFADTKTGIHEAVQTVMVDEGNPPHFSVTRESSTHVFTGMQGHMRIEVVADSDFTGTIVETVPADMTVMPAEKEHTYTSVSSLRDTVSLPGTLAHVMDPHLVHLQLPFLGQYAVSQGFGSTLTAMPMMEYYLHLGLVGHDGVDFALPMQTPLVAVEDGIVAFAGQGSYGNTVIIQHAWGKSYYGHLDAVSVKQGDFVLKGSILGVSGSSGDSTGPHLHFAIKPYRSDINNGYGGMIDPMPFFEEGQEGAHAADVLGDAIVASMFGGLAASQSADQAASPPALLLPPSNHEASSSAEEKIASPSVVPIDPTLVDSLIKQRMKETPQYIDGNVKLVKWQVQLKKGEKKELSYKYLLSTEEQVYRTQGLTFFASEQKKQVYEEQNGWLVSGAALSSAWVDASWPLRKAMVIDHTTLGLPSLDTTSPVQQGQHVSSLSWNHVVNNVSNRLLLVGIVTKKTGVRNVTFGTQPLIQLTQGNCPGGKCHSEIWYTTSPPVGKGTVSVSLNQEDSVTAGSTSMSDVSRAQPFATTHSITGTEQLVTTQFTKQQNQLLYSLVGTNSSTVQLSASQAALWVGERGSAVIDSGTDTNTPSWRFSDFPNSWVTLWVPVNPVITPSQLMLLPIPAKQQDMVLTDTKGKRLSMQFETVSKKATASAAWITVDGLSEDTDTILYLYTTPKAAK